MQQLEAEWRTLQRDNVASLHSITVGQNPLCACPEHLITAEANTLCYWGTANC
jgi:hypothetical protein